MAGMFRNKDENCRKINGGLAGQSRRRCKPPRDRPHSTRFSAPFEAKLNEVLSKHAFDSYADYHEAAMAAFLFLTKEGPLPTWADVNSK